MTLDVPYWYNAAVALVDGNLAAGRSDKIAYIDDRGSTTYGALAQQVNRAANLVRELGVAPEQRVLLCLHDSVSFPTLFLGAIRAGVVPVPVNTLLTSQDYAHMIGDSRAKVVFVSDALAPKVEEAISTLVENARPRVIREGELAGMLAPLPDTAEPARTTRDDVAFWLYSSGSTGAPKGATHLHASLARTAELYARGILGMTADDVVFSAAKLFFAYGLGNALTFPLAVGATAILMAERPTPAAVMRTIREHRPTIFCGVPTLFASILADDANVPGPDSRLRACTSAGEALPKHVGEAWRARFGVDVYDGIGSTEMLHIFLSTRPGDVRYGTTGKAVPGYELELRDDEGRPSGDEGILWVRGETACTGYWNQREKSLATFHGPWTRTGDRYTRDADGYFTYAGRADDMLKVGGIWVSPFEVESALAKHPLVLEAAVVGWPDADGLVKPKAFVVLKDPGAAMVVDVGRELQTFVKSMLAPYKYPRWIEIVTELPKTATGKIQRFKLRPPRA